MGLFTEKKGVILGVANGMSIATAVSEYLFAEGASLAFSYLPDETGKSEKRASSALAKLPSPLLIPCNALSDESIEKFFKTAFDSLGNIDFLVHSIAFASIEELRKPTLEVSRKGFLEAIDASTYSLIATARECSKYMNDGASIVSMTYFGGEKVIPGYNLMGVCKAALDHSIRYLAYDLGARNIRVNGVSAGPIRTLASSAVSDFKQMLKINEAMSPLGRNVTAEDVGKSTGFLLSDHASSITGEIIHVDCGYNIMGSLTPKLKEMIKD